MNRQPRVIAALIAISILLAACGAAGGGSAGGTPGTSELKKVTLDMGYVPNVQFAPFYLAARRGYYRQAGLDVHFKHGIESNMVKLIATGKEDFGIVSGDEMLTARSQGMPLVYVGAWYQKYPVVLITRKSEGITSVRQLKGRTIGVPGLYGSTYLGLKALLYSAGMTEQDVSIRPIGFTQVQALQRGQVDAVMGYANNEPLQLERIGVRVNTIPVWQHTNLISNGIVTNEKTLREHPDEVRALVEATMKGVRDTTREPDAAFEATLKYVSEAAQNRKAQMQVLRATIPLWQSKATQEHGLGYSDPDGWRYTRDFLERAGLLKQDLDLKTAYTNRFVLKTAAGR